MQVTINQMEVISRFFIPRCTYTESGYIGRALYHRQGLHENASTRTMEHQHPAIRETPPGLWHIHTARSARPCVGTSILTKTCRRLPSIRRRSWIGSGSTSRQWCCLWKMMRINARGVFHFYKDLCSQMT